MKTAPGRDSAIVAVLTVLRIALGVLFLISSISKLQDIPLFVDAVQEYGILPGALAEIFATMLPWAELFIGLCLVLGVFVTFASAITAAMVLSFIVANITSFFRDVGEACGCLGDLVTMSHQVSLVVDVAMLLVAGLLIHQRRRARTVGVAGVARAVAGRRKWLAVALQLVLVALLTGAIGGAITAASQERPPSGLDKADYVFLYFWDGCSSCYDDQIDAVESLRPGYEDRVYFSGVDYQKLPNWAKTYEIDVEGFTVLLLARDSESGELAERARFFSYPKSASFDLAAIQDSLDAMVGAGGQ